MLWTAFTIGLFGSLHCVGMCGPIALAMPYDNSNKFQTIGKILLYNFGRTLTYVLLGILIGLLGEGLFLAGIQRWTSIFMGIGVLIIALFSINIESRLLHSNVVGRFFFFVKSQLAKHLKNSSHSAFFRTGFLNGFLPCGLVYMAIIGAVTMGSIEGSALYMFLFGLGTIPLMISTVLVGNLASFKIRNRIKKFYPAFLIALAFLLIFRGIQFDVPADFSFWEAMTNIPMCH
jgi:sulfite exporter TauE/SafE